MNACGGNAPWFGVTRTSVEQLSGMYDEPVWLRAMRQQAFDAYVGLKTPTHLAHVQQVLDEHVCVHACATPESVACALEPGAEMMAANGLQVESQVVRQELLEQWRAHGVIFCDLLTAVRQYPELVQKFLGSIVAADDNKYAALASAFWTGGMFVYVPEGVQVLEPIHMHYFIGLQNFGQFERTLVIAEPGSSLHLVEGCSSVVDECGSVHAGVVELHIGNGAQVRYTSMQNWSRHIHHVATKRAVVHAQGSIEWATITAGAHTSCMYPTSVLVGPEAQAHVAALSLAKAGQHQYGGARMLHCAPNTQSSIVSRALVGRAGHADTRACVRVDSQASNVRSYAACHARALGEGCRISAVPELDIRAHDAQVTHEASTSTLGHEQLVYLMSRGLDFDQAHMLATIGFVDAVSKQLPLELALEVERLVADMHTW